ncbi:MAG: hypothetical protein ACJA01_002334, partial [Saprospiraceae bacterium]
MILTFRSGLMLISSKSLEFIEQLNFINFSALTYLLLHSETDPQKLESKFPDLVLKYASGQILNNFGGDYAEYQKQGNGYNYSLQPNVVQLRNWLIRGMVESFCSMLDLVASSFSNYFSGAF